MNAKGKQPQTVEGEGRRGSSGTQRRSDVGQGAAQGMVVGNLGDELAAALIKAIREQTGAVERAGAVRDSAAPSWYAFALEYLDMRWPLIAAKTRDETSDALCVITLAMLRDLRDRPSDQLIRHALRGWAFVVPRAEPRNMPTDVRLALHWVAGASRPLTDLLNPRVMRSVLTALRLKQDSTAAAAETQRRKRKVLVHAVHYAMEQRKLPADPLAPIQWRVAAAAEQVDPRVVANPAQARELLCAVSYVGSFRRPRGRRLVGLFAGMYYAGLRPAEAVAVGLPACVLPAEGWGQATLSRTLPQAGKRWTDTGRLHDERGLKNRPVDDVRVVPLPPELVELWKWSADTFGTADDGRLFFNERGGIVASTTYDRVWHEARELGLPSDLVHSPLAARPYDLPWCRCGVTPIAALSPPRRA